MTTALEPSTQVWNRDATQQKVRHPLHRLRGLIRGYVSVEGTAVLLVYMALWFWIGLLVDFGFFKMFGVDWVQELPLPLRGSVLGLLVVGLIGVVASRVLFRLIKEYGHGPLALVLERRFPRELGDRLITAVEMADTRLAERYGYSQTMLDQTIREAAERVSTLPVAQVLDWHRLRRHLFRVLVLTVGLYIIVGGVYCSASKTAAREFMIRFGHVASMWFERNILLKNTLWPRRAQLELVDFPSSGELRIGRDAPPPTLRVRALRWLVADSSMEDGWRSMRWQDISANLLGEDSIPQVLPPEWRNWSLDDIQIEMGKPEGQRRLGLEALAGMRRVFELLHDRAQLPSMARRFRELIIPRDLTVYYKGETVRSEQTLKKQGENDYAGLLSDLKESVRFTVNGEDYYTRYNRITLVPPPSIVVLTRTDEHFAYLYHRPPADHELSFLKGKKHVLKDVPVSLSGNASRVDVPIGSTITLKAKTDKPLRAENGVRLRPQEHSGPVNAPVVVTDPQNFELRFANVAATLDFIVELTDTDNVVGLRRVIIRPIEDMPPEVDFQVEVVRKVGQGYLITPSARMPFSGKIRDDHGLSSVDFQYTLASLESQAAANLRQIASSWNCTPASALSGVSVPLYLGWIGTQIRSTADDSKQTPQSMPLGSFASRSKEAAAQAPTLAVWQERLTDRIESSWLRDLTLDPNDEKEGTFDVARLGLKVSDERDPQPRFRMRLWIAAADNNVETGPSVGLSKERFVFLIVSENELLVEIAKEEESLHIKLEDSVNKLKEARNKLEGVKTELPLLKPTEFSPMARRLEELLDTLGRGLDVSREVHSDYQRILRELQVNRVRSQIIERVERGICIPLNEIVQQEFERTEKSLKAFFDSLEAQKKEPGKADQASADLQQLIDRLVKVLEAMADIMTINKLIEQLVILHREELRASEEFKRRHDELMQRILDQATEGPEAGKKPDK